METVLLQRGVAELELPFQTSSIRSLSLFRMLFGKCPSGQRGKRQRRDKGLKLGFIKIIIIIIIIIIELKSLCVGLICCCNFIFGLLRILLGFFLCYLDFLCVIWVFFFCVIWVFVMCGECFNFRLFGLFAVLLIDLSSLIFFF